MYKIPVSEIKAKIVESGKLSAEEFDIKVKAKINDLSGLISQEGAAHIIANEFGITFAPKEGEKIQIKQLAAGMNNASVLVKVIQKWEVREFDKGSYKGKVCSLLVGDETGSTRFTLWNDQVDEIKDVKEGDTLLIHGGYVKENRGKVEFHLGRGGTFEVNPDGQSVGDVKNSGGAASGSFTRKQITALEGDEEGVELFGTVVQVFDPRFFNVHPETGKRMYDDDDSGLEPAISYVMNVILDDGSSTIRCVFWKNQVNSLLGADEARMGGYKEDLSTFEDEKTDLLGEQIVLRGRVKHNEMFDRLEFSVQFVEKADPEKEIAKVKTEAVVSEEVVADVKTEEVAEVKEEAVAAEPEVVTNVVPEPAASLDEIPAVESVEAEEVVNSSVVVEEEVIEEAVVASETVETPVAEEVVSEAKEEVVATETVESSEEAKSEEKAAEKKEGSPEIIEEEVIA
jgi:hypothetical protein